MNQYSTDGAFASTSARTSAHPPIPNKGQPTDSAPILAALQNVSGPTQSGEYLALCPFHDDTKTSLNFNPAKGVFKCHACGEKGNARQLADKLGVYNPSSGPTMPKPKAAKAPKAAKGAPIESVFFDYTDENGTTLFRVNRKKFADGSKDFPVSRSDGNGGFIFGLGDAQPVLYALPRLAAAQTVFVVEGEKCADALNAAFQRAEVGSSYMATTAPFGGGKWRASHSQALAGKRVFVLPDNDEPGEKHAAQVCAGVHPFASRVALLRLPDLPDKGDVLDFLEAGGTVETLCDLMEAAPMWTPSAPTETEPEPTAKARGHYALNEIGNGQRFADANRGRYLFDYTANRWRVYVGGVWRHTDGDDVERAAKVIEAQICDEARGESDDDRRAKLYKHAGSMTKRKTRETMLKDAASELGMSAPPENFDAQLHLFNVQNGTLDLHSFELRPHDPRDLLTKCAGTKFDQGATAPTWTRALETWMPDAATRDYLQECAGLSLSGEVRDEFFNFLFGGGANGKTTFLSMLESVSGDYYRHAKAEIFMRPKFARDGESATPAMLSLQGARLLTVSEIEGEHEMSAALVKGLTGRDPITARGCHDRRPTTFRPQFTLWMFGNEKPKISDASDGMWRRVRLIEFNQIIPKAERDTDFAEKLGAELSGILNWALEGLRRVQQRGLVVPHAVEISTDSYRAEQDAMSGFLAEKCELSATAFVTSAELWDAWKSFCDDKSEPQGTPKTFGAALKNRNCKDDRATINGTQTRVWNGVKLKN